MKIIVGLGNPGIKYENTRHNVGYMVIDKLKTQMSNVKTIIAVKTNVFMNESGGTVKNLIKDYRLNTKDIYIIHDDLDISLGQFKIQFAKGPKVHNGVASVEEALGTEEFWRVRVGIENRDMPKIPRGEEYVLQKFTEEEKMRIDETIMDVVQAVIQHVRHSPSSQPQ